MLFSHVYAHGRSLSLRQIGLVATLLLLAALVAPITPASAGFQQAEQQARAAFEAGRYQEAYTALRPALEAEPERPDLWFLLGQIVSAMGQPERALMAYDSAIGLNPDAPAPWFTRGITLLALQRFEEAAVSLEQCLKLSPNQPGIALYLGMARLGAGNPAGALMALANADPTAPDYGEVVRRRAEALRELGRSNEALDEATAYLETNPEYQPVRFEMALAQAELGNAAAALLAIRRAAVSVPPYPPAVLEYARGLRDSDDVEDHIEAAGLYRHSLASFPGDGTMRAELASLYAELGLEAEAGDEAARVVQIAPDDPDALLIAGNVLLLVRRPDDALAALEKAAALAPDDPLIHHHHGLALAELWRFDEALAAFDRALELDAMLIATRVEAARAALRNGAPETAVEVLEAAGPMAEGNAEAMAMLGEAYVESDRFEEAVPALQRAQQLDAELAETPYLLARAYRAIGREDLADEALAEFQARSGAQASAAADSADAIAYQRRLTRTRAAVFVAEGRFDEAIAILQAAVSERPDDPELYDLMAAAYDGLGNEEQAAEMRRRADELRRAPATPTDTDPAQRYHDAA